MATAKRVRTKDIKVKFKCPFCNHVHTVHEWNTHSERNYGRMSRKLPYGRGCSFMCPSCSHNVGFNNMRKIIYIKGVETDGYYYNE